MQISKKSQYGLRAMVYLAKQFKGQKTHSLKEISSKEGIPFDFLERIFRELEKKKYIKAKKGVLGGYFLNNKPSRITVSQIVNTLEDTSPVKCSFCGRSRKCLTKNVWKKVEKSINETLNSITLKDLIS